MPRILIVDDSEVDRVFARRLLERDFQVDCASDAQEALAKIAERAPDVVVTDLVMPGMDGLDLVTEVRDRYPFVPVLIMTAKGGEEIALRALQQGAASYVPKRVLENELCDTIECVLAAAAQRHDRSELLHSMREGRWTFELGNDRALFRPLVQYLHETMMRFGLFDDSERMRIGVAVEEALNNAAEHGNLELDSALRAEDLAGYVDQMDRRCHVAPYRDRRIHFEARLSRMEAAFVIRDEGNGFDPSQIADPLQPQNLDAVSGRGITLMRMFMDEVDFNDVGNQVTLVKRVEASVA